MPVPRMKLCDAFAVQLWREGIERTAFSRWNGDDEAEGESALRERDPSQEIYFDR
jgi:hypothetical protein